MNNGNKMDELEKNLPDNFWRKAFEEVAETPPPRVWEAIERRLDESEGPKILPLWGSGLASSRSVMWGTGLAAGVALLLVGWWVIKTPTVTHPLAKAQHSENEIAVRKPSLKSAASATLPNPALNTIQTEAVAANSRTTQKVRRSLGHILLPERPLSDVTPTIAIQSAGRLTIADGPIPGSATLYSAPNSVAKSAVSQVAAVSYLPVGNQSLGNLANPMPNTLVQFEKLTGKPMRFRRSAIIQRVVWIRPVEPFAEPTVLKSKHKSRELWASVNMMPNSFNPLVSVHSAAVNTALASSAISTQSSAVNSQANFSVAYQAGAGVQLTERWSVESGIGYLSGHSTVETPGQQALASIQQDALATHTTASNNLYLDALRSSLQAKTIATNTAQASYNNVVANTAYRPQAVYDNRNQQLVTNNYQYIQVPVQVGYQIRPRKRLSMAVLGGLLTNIFVRNTVGNEIVVSAKDGVYKPVSLAATMGARLRYRPSQRWSASLAGVYQPSLESGTQADSQVQSRPTSAGMSFGVDYHF